MIFGLLCLLELCMLWVLWIVTFRMLFKLLNYSTEPERTDWQMAQGCVSFIFVILLALGLSAWSVRMFYVVTS